MAKALTVHRIDKLLRAGAPGKHTDGDMRGLMLCVESKTSAYWLLRYQRNKIVKHMGLGSAHDVSLKTVRQRARRERERLADGVDPLELKRADREAQRQAGAQRHTVKEAAELCPTALEPGGSSGEQHEGVFSIGREGYL